MGQITSGTGLISGIDIASLVDQLVAVEARPKSLIQNRNSVLNSQQVAFQDINANLLSLKTSADNLADTDTFKVKSATSSNESVLSVTAGTSSTPGTYDFTVDRLLQTQQAITKGFQDKDSTAVGAGTMTFEFGEGRLDTDSKLTQLNGSEGINRGKVRITDRSGASAVIDLSKALTVNDVLEQINNASGIDVTARAEGDQFVIDDNTGLAASNLTVSDLGTTGTATSLGIAQSVAGDTLTGSQVNTIGSDTRLSALNDGNGVRFKSVNDFQVTQRDGTTFNVNLSDVQTVGEVIDAINAASSGAGGSITASINDDGTGIKLVDGSSGGGTLAVSALNSSQAAADLGILGADDDADGTIDGDRVIANLNSKLLKNLLGGTGSTPGEIEVTNSAGATTPIDLSGIASVDEVIRAINNAGAGVTASLNSAANGIKITDNAGGAGDLTIADTNGDFATTLNLAGSFSGGVADSGNAQIQYITEATRLDSLNGGKGVNRGKFTITDSDGDTATVDLTQGNEVTIADVISEINSRGLDINARINDTGDGILIEDTGIGAVALKVEESGGTIAAGLGLLGEAANPGDDLDGSFEKQIEVDAADTLQDVADKINDAGIGVRATIINDGSGNNPYRLNLLAADAGRAGAFVLDSGGVDLEANTLVEARNGVVFFGSQDPAKAIAVETASNTLTSLIPGATINLHSTSDAPVRVSIDDDYSAITDAAEDFVGKFNKLITTFNKYDTYNEETEERGLLLGDSTIQRVRSGLFNRIIGRDSDLDGQFSALSQIGIRVGTGTKLSLDKEKLQAALESNFAAVRDLFTLKETETDETTGETTITAGGIGTDIAELLKGMTDATNGTIALRLNTISDQVQLNKDRIAQIDEQLASKRERLMSEFIAMETSLARLQQQSSAISGLSSISGGGGGGGGLQNLIGQST